MSSFLCFFRFMFGSKRRTTNRGPMSFHFHRFIPIFNNVDGIHSRGLRVKFRPFDHPLCQLSNVAVMASSCNSSTFQLRLMSLCVKCFLSRDNRNYSVKVIVRFRSTNRNSSVRGAFHRSSHVNFVRASNVMIVGRSKGIIFHKIPMARSLMPTTVSNLTIINICVLFQPNVTKSVTSGHAIVSSQGSSVIHMTQVRPTNCPSQRVLMVIRARTTPLRVQVPRDTLMGIQRFSQRRFIICFFHLILLRRIRIRQYNGIDYLRGRRIRTASDHRGLLRYANKYPTKRTINRREPTINDHLTSMSARLATQLSTRQTTQGSGILATPIPFNAHLTNCLQGRVLVFLCQRFRVGM